MSEKDPLDVALGSIIRRYRGAQNMTLDALAKRIGCTYQQVQKYETGANRVAFSTLVRIAKAFECGTGLLAGEAVIEADEMRGRRVGS